MQLGPYTCCMMAMQEDTPHALAKSPRLARGMQHYNQLRYFRPTEAPFCQLHLKS